MQKKICHFPVSVMQFSNIIPQSYNIQDSMVLAQK